MLYPDPMAFGVIFIVVIVLAALVSPVGAVLQWRTGSPGPDTLGWLTAVSAIGVGGFASVIGVLAFLVGVLFADSPDAHGHILPLWVPVVGPVLTVVILVTAYTAAVRRSAVLARVAAAAPLMLAVAVVAVLWSVVGPAGQTTDTYDPGPSSTPSSSSTPS